MVLKMGISSTAFGIGPGQTFADIKDVRDHENVKIAHSSDNQ